MSTLRIRSISAMRSSFKSGGQPASDSSAWNGFVFSFMSVSIEPTCCYDYACNQQKTQYGAFQIILAELIPGSFQAHFHGTFRQAVHIGDFPNTNVVLV